MLGFWRRSEPVYLIRPVKVIRWPVKRTLRPTYLAVRDGDLSETLSLSAVRPLPLHRRRQLSIHQIQLAPATIPYATATKRSASPPCVPTTHHGSAASAHVASSSKPRRRSPDATPSAPRSS